MKPATPRSLKTLLAEIAGWYGVLAILGAYVLLSFEVLESNSVAYQLLNLTGALGVLVISVHKKVFQSILLNTVWALVAIIALVQLVQ